MCQPYVSNRLIIMPNGKCMVSCGISCLKSIILPPGYEAGENSQNPLKPTFTIHIVGGSYSFIILSILLSGINHIKTTMMKRAPEIQVFIQNRITTMFSD